ncbi:MAG: ATP-binding cassette domain-containing protein [Lachnospiraceae bacterium]|jgi:ABC-2 type transport system ATP-binding protein|nr:ATP-binding cassette domain-containing protein [Lachnospiraceae bacterium]
MRTIVDINSVEKSYGLTQVINHCSFKIFEGEIYGLLGINGAGKTTLMKMILGLQQIDRGSIYVLGQKVSNNPEYLSNIGSVIENPTFYEHLNARELLSMHLCYMQKKADISEILHLVGLENADKKTISEYSLGMKQRLNLARAIIHHPKLLILDEPLNGLDPIAISEMRGLMKKLTNEGISILLSSHIIGEVRHTADRIGILSDGYIKQEFSVKEKISEFGEHFEDYVIRLMRREQI